MKNGFSKTVLKNGMRVITERIPSVRSVSIGIWIHVGSRDENESTNGISHFIEHMHFKGTQKRNALKIAYDLESRGGAINAFTSREHTCYYVRIMSSHLGKAIEILADILNNSTFTPGNIKKEKSVILEEIKDVADSPSEYIHDLFTSRMWSSHPLGHPIMGTANTVNDFTKAKIIKYLKNNYQSSNLVVAAAGDVSHKKMVELVNKYFNWPSSERKPECTIPVDPGFKLHAHHNGTQQTHVSLGFPSIGFADPDRYAVLAANTLLSGGMSSRLFQNIREKKGYCYTIYSYQEFFQDIGLFSVYFGTDKKFVIKSTDLVLKELHKLKEKVLSKSELLKIKDQLKGNLMLALESTTNRMNRIARQELMLDSYIDMDETCRNIDSIKPSHIRNAANRIFVADQLTLVSLGTAKKKDLENINWSYL